MYNLFVCFNIASTAWAIELLFYCMTQISASMSARTLTGCFQIDPNVAPNQFGNFRIKCLFYRPEQADRQTN